jgi:hypothetical protein
MATIKLCYSAGSLSPTVKSLFATCMSTKKKNHSLQQFFLNFLFAAFEAVLLTPGYL